MPRSPSGCRGRWLLTTVALLAPLLGTGCTLVQPGCRNRDVKAAIEQEARESVERWIKTSASSSSVPEMPVSLADQLEVDRHDKTHSCSANVMVGQGQDEVKLPVEYEVVASDNGQPYYQWDRDEFDRAIIANAMMSAFLTAAHAHADHDKEPEAEHQPDTVTAPDRPPSAGPQPESATAPLDIEGVWKRNVGAEIVRRAKALTDMPSGTQRMRFRIGPDGELTIASARPPIENTVLADKLVTFLETSGRVAKPPFGKVTWVEMMFQF